MDAWGLDELEMMGKITPHIIFHHINHHGCVMLLYTLTARTDMEARAKVIGAARTLAEFAPKIRGKRGLKRVHASLVLMVSLYVSVLLQNNINDSPYFIWL